MQAFIYDARLPVQVGKTHFQNDNPISKDIEQEHFSSPKLTPQLWWEERNNDVICYAQSTQCAVCEI